MHNYINFFAKKSDLIKPKNEFYDYNPKKVDKEKKEFVFEYKKILEPTVNDYIILDFETTGFSPINEKILEIGAIKVIDGKIVDKFDELIDPEKIIPPFISSKINITNQMVFGKRKISSVLPELVQFIGKFPIIAHNAKFDMGFLIYNMQKLGFEFQNSVIDTLYLSRKLLKLKKNNLTFLADYFGIEYNNAHRAFADVLALFEVYKKLKELYEKDAL